jgi:hypothetical protein
VVDFGYWWYIRGEDEDLKEELDEDLMLHVSLQQSRSPPSPLHELVFVAHTFSLAFGPHHQHSGKHWFCRLHVQGSHGARKRKGSSMEH